MASKILAMFVFLCTAATPLAAGPTLEDVDGATSDPTTGTRGARSILSDGAEGATRDATGAISDLTDGAKGALPDTVEGMGALRRMAENQTTNETVHLPVNEISDRLDDLEDWLSSNGLTIGLALIASSCCIIILLCICCCCCGGRGKSRDPDKGRLLFHQKVVKMPDP